jgi:outer membrane biosynthesis protein TonB
MAASLRPALAGSVALHILVLGAGLIVFPQSVVKMQTAVPVTIVNRAPTPDLRPAIEAPTPEEALSPEPAEAPEPAPEAPEPAPAPTPPAPPPPPVKAPAPPKPAAAPLDLDALASRLPKARPRPRPALDLDRLAAPQARRNANAARGAARPEAATEARPAAGAAQGLTADEASLLASKLNRLWRPNCVAEGGANIQVRVNIQLTPGGTLSAPPRLIGAQQNNPLWAAAAQRALSAVRQGEPYNELPRERYAQWKDINFNFNARQACLGM